MSFKIRAFDLSTLPIDALNNSEFKFDINVYDIQSIKHKLNLTKSKLDNIYKEYEKHIVSNVMKSFDVFNKLKYNIKNIIKCDHKFHKTTITLFIIK